MIPNYTIYSDKVFLTANYYIEYLGFNLLYKVEEAENPYVWLEFNNQFLLIWPWNNKLGIARPAVFEVPNIEDWFFEIQQRVKINVPLFIEKKTDSFSILDCEENLIHFTAQTSRVVENLDSMDINELAFEPKNI
ncbi:MAG TPA: hypothetical protein VHO90_12870 [Bacteroidales bacterium]|nr:hypothetical protein [Bacteroidales bacterium]